MQSPDVKIDFQVMERTFRQFVRAKAIKAHSTIVYVENGKLIEEDPATDQKIVLGHTPFPDH